MFSILRLSFCLAAASLGFLLTGCTIDDLNDFLDTPSSTTGSYCESSAPPVVLAPSYYCGYGYGYWYRHEFYPYRHGCTFYRGYYYHRHHHEYGESCWH